MPGENQMNNKVTENKMGTMPVNKLLISMSVPMMISMLVQALYNIVDSIFVSHVSENALTAVSLAFPIQNLMIAVAVGTGVGVNALLSRSLGEKNFTAANQAATNGIFMYGITALLFVFVGVFTAGPFFRTQTTIDEIANYGISYLQIICIFGVGVFGQVIFERLLQSTGKTIYSMIVQASGAIINIILDPIMIFGLFGFPRLEVAGAALATVIGQCFAALLGLFINLKVNKEISLSFEKFRPNGEIIKRIYVVGIPSIIMQSVSSILIYGLNQILIQFTETATAVFGVYFKLQSFVFMPVFGLNNGMIPIVAYNLGAKKIDRLKKTFVLSLMYAISIMFIGFLCMQIFPETFLSLFKATDRMIAIGVPALRAISISFLLAGFCIITTSLFQALGNGFISMVISIVRQLVVLLPAAYLLSKLNNLNLVWYAFPIAEGFSLVLCIIYLRKFYKTVLKD